MRLFLFLALHHYRLVLWEELLTNFSWCFSMLLNSACFFPSERSLSESRWRNSTSALTDSLRRRPSRVRQWPHQEAFTTQPLWPVSLRDDMCWVLPLRIIHVVLRFIYRRESSHSLILYPQNNSCESGLAKTGHLVALPECPTASNGPRCCYEFCSLSEQTHMFFALRDCKNHKCVMRIWGSNLLSKKQWWQCSFIYWVWAVKGL